MTSVTLKNNHQSRVGRWINNLSWFWAGLALATIAVMSQVDRQLTAAWVASTYASPTPNMPLHELMDDVAGVWIVAGAALAVSLVILLIAAYIAYVKDRLPKS